jgi:integrase
VSRRVAASRDTSCADLCRHLRGSAELVALVGDARTETAHTEHPLHVRIGRKSRRTLALPARCVAVLRVQLVLVAALKAGAGDSWQEHDLVFPTLVGTEADAANVRRAFRKVTAAAGLDPADWTPRELRHSFVSLMSDAGVPLEKIAQLVDHSGTTVTEEVYRKQIRPVITDGAETIDRLFPSA